MDKLTAEPGTVQFLGQLLEISQRSDHPMDKAATKALQRLIWERIKALEELADVARGVWQAWNDEHICFPNQMQLLHIALAGLGDVEDYKGQPNWRISALRIGEAVVDYRRRSKADGA